MRLRRPDGGFTAIELVLVLTIMGIILAAGLPRATVAYEYSRVHRAKANLNTLWSAQRLFRIQAGTFADDLQDLVDTGLAPGSLLTGGEFWDYEALSGTESDFRMQARRRQGNGWSGTIVLRDTGAWSGGVNHVGGASIQP